jgi:hypothetical protein
MSTHVEDPGSATHQDTPTNVTAGYYPAPLPDLTQESIDSFVDRDVRIEGPRPKKEGSRALEGLAREMEIERVALSEASTGISRDEMLLTIAREVKIPLEDLDLVDAYLTDMELEGLVRRVGDLVVLSHHDDGDLLGMDLSEREFLAMYRRRYKAAEGGGGR